MCKRKHWKGILLPLILYCHLGPIGAYYHRPLTMPPLCHWVYRPGGQSAQWVEPETMTSSLQRRQVPYLRIRQKNWEGLIIRRFVAKQSDIHSYIHIAHLKDQRSWMPLPLHLAPPTLSHKSDEHWIIENCAVISSGIHLLCQPSMEHHLQWSVLAAGHCHWTLNYDC